MDAERRIFAAEALTRLRTTASLVPSSSHLTRAMVAPLPLERARCIVEFGPGTGTMTRALLEGMPAGALLLAFEVNPRFVDYLRKTLPDPRLLVVAASAERVGEELRAHGIEEIDGAVSSLGLTWMPDGIRHGILRALLPFLSRNGVFTQFQYLHSLLGALQVAEGRLELFTAERLLRRYFSRVSHELVWGNLPPAFAFTCRC